MFKIGHLFKIYWNNYPIILIYVLGNNCKLYGK